MNSTSDPALESCGTCGHGRLTHGRDRCYGIPIGAPTMMARVGVDKLRTSTRKCPCEKYEPVR